ncbi:MAG: GNAT family N-acetyltransferase [Gammaproteobacteria bacterium]|nr:GNAT family N-acetyltransferase [Gammaproteobacteria bacterium]
MTFVIKQPKTEDEFKRYYHLRWKLLRAPWNQPEGSEIDELEDQCFHLMAVDEDEIIGVARLQFNSSDEAQIRYMAVANGHEKKGIGRALVTVIEARAKTSRHDKIILHAREPAIGFYQKLGYEIIEKSYLLFGEIQHFKMMKACTTK